MEEQTHNRKIEAALLEWINSFPLKKKIDSYNSFDDGHVMWEVLRDIDSDYFQHDLPEFQSNSGRWVSRWQNLKTVSRSLTTYLTEECKQYIADLPSMEDLRLIAQDISRLGTLKLLKLVLLAAIKSPRQLEYISRMPSLSTSTQISLKSLIEEMQYSGDSESDNERSYHGTSIPSTPARDPELLLEERFAKLMVEKDQYYQAKMELQKGLGELHDRLIRLQENNDVLQGKLTEAEDQLRGTNSKENVNRDLLVKRLEAKSRQQENIITELEVKLSECQKSNDAMKKTVDRFHASSGKTQKLRDELDEIKAERDNLARKANAAERYKKKLQATQNLEKENSDLQEELKEVKQQFESADRDRQKIPGLEVTVEEYKRILPKIEQDRHELQMMKRQLEKDNGFLTQKLEAADEHLSRELENTAKLNEKLSQINTSRASSPVGKRDLDSELARGLNVERQLQVVPWILTWMRLLTLIRKANINQLEAEKKELSQSLDELRSQQKEFQKHHLEVYNDKLVLEANLAEALSGSDDPIKSTDAFRKLREQIGTERDKRQKLEQELSTLKAQLRSSEERCMLLQPLYEQIMKEHSDLIAAYTSTDTNNAENSIEDKKPNQASAAENQNESGRRISQPGTMLMPDQVPLSDGLDEVDELQSCEMSQKDIETLLETIKITISKSPLSPDFNEFLEKQISVYGDKMRQGSDRLTKRIEHSNKQDAVTKGLRERVEYIENQTSRLPAPPSSNNNSESETSTLITQQQQQLIENLKRENKLMASAYHELAGRLQLNSVILQRRTDAPRTWLNRQRKLVDLPAIKGLGR